jgi:hypothetical protein
MKIQMFLVALLLALDSAADPVNLEVYAANDAGGYIVLTHESCQLSKYSKEYPYRGYATTNEANIVYEGCYDVPSVADAPKIPGYKVFPMVNFIDGDGLRVEWPLDIFKPEKENNQDYTL